MTHLFTLAAATPGTGEDTPLPNAVRAPSQAAQQLSTTGDGSSGLVRTLVGLAVVIGVIYGVAWLLRQAKASRDERTTGMGLSHAATVALGPNRSLHLVRAGRELILVGSAEQGVVPIRTYTEEEARDIGLLVDEDDGPDAGSPGARPAALRTTARGAQLVVDRLRELTRR